MTEFMSLPRMMSKQVSNTIKGRSKFHSLYFCTIRLAQKLKPMTLFSNFMSDRNIQFVWDFYRIFSFESTLPCPILLSFFPHPWRAVRSYRPPFIDGLLAEVFLNRKVNVRGSVHSPGTISLAPLSLADRRDTRGKWTMARNPAGAGVTG